MSILDTIKSWFGRAGSAVERERAGAEPVATSPDHPGRETSTNAQVGGAAGEPYPDEG